MDEKGEVSNVLEIGSKSSSPIVVLPRNVLALG
jgi:hypothetical protein